MAHQPMFRVLPIHVVRSCITYGYLSFIHRR